MDSSLFLSLTAPSNATRYSYCKTCKRALKFKMYHKEHNCTLKPLDNDQPKKNVIRKQNLDLSKHCGVIIGPSGIPCMRSLTCKSHSMASKRSVKNRVKDFDVLLNEYLQMHPPKNVAKTLPAAAVNLDLMSNSDIENINCKHLKLDETVPFTVKRSKSMYISLKKQANIANYRSLFSFIEHDRNNKIPRAM